MKHISMEEFHEKFYPSIKSSDLLLDVRTAAEFEEFRIERSFNKTHLEILGALDEVNKHELVYVYCRRGARAVYACEQLMANGVDANKLICISDGGMERWAANGNPIISS